MKFDSNCKAIIESMNKSELMAYVDFLWEEIERHYTAKNHNWNECRMWREFMATDHTKALIKLNQSAIYRHRLDIKSTRECILKAEDRMEMLEFLS